MQCYCYGSLKSVRNNPDHSTLETFTYDLTARAKRMEVLTRIRQLLYLFEISYCWIYILILYVICWSCFVDIHVAMSEVISNKRIGTSWLMCLLNDKLLMVPESCDEVWCQWWVGNSTLMAQVNCCYVCNQMMQLWHAIHVAGPLCDYSHCISWTFAEICTVQSKALCHATVGIPLGHYWP